MMNEDHGISSSNDLVGMDLAPFTVEENEINSFPTDLSKFLCSPSEEWQDVQMTHNTADYHRLCMGLNVRR